MTLLALGINHNTAPVEVRERVYFSPQVITEALRGLAALPNVSEAAILSTCNRTELLCEADTDTSHAIIEWLKRYHRLDSTEIEPFVYIHPAQNAVRHLLRVSAGLDSMILGEPQILGQVKQAYSAALDAGTLGKHLGRLFQHCFAVAKQIRTDTAIGASPVSVAFAAVGLARQIFADLGQHEALLIGAGETIELAARHLSANRVRKITIANRTLDRAAALAREFSAHPITLPDIPAELAKADIVVSSTASPLPILGKGAVERAVRQRKHRPMLMVDIAVPRDIEPEVGELDDVYLYTVDDLKEIIDEGLTSRREAAEQAEEIIDRQVQQFMGWLRSLNSVGTIRAFREDAAGIRQHEIDKARRMIAAGQDPDEVIQRLAHVLTNKLLHNPTVKLREAGYEGREDIVRAARELFDLDDLAGR